jgi:hypothetical protein
MLFVRFKVTVDDEDDDLSRDGRDKFEIVDESKKEREKRKRPA